MYKGNVLIQITPRGRARAENVTKRTPALIALSLLEDRGPCTADELLQRMGVSEQTGKEILREMNRRSYIRKSDGSGEVTTE